VPPSEDAGQLFDFEFSNIGAPDDDDDDGDGYGSGYGSGLKGDQIPLAARIFAVADVFDALTSRRPYKEPLPVEEALAILEQGRGTHFDPGVLDLFAPLARPLHQRHAGEEGAGPRAEVGALLERYFQADLGALLSEQGGPDARAGEPPAGAPPTAAPAGRGRRAGSPGP
jgi:hypothetical protein